MDRSNNFRPFSPSGFWISVLSLVLLAPNTFAQSSSFSWPEGRKAALSLTFDDARLSQIDTGLAILEVYGVKATFYVSPFSMEKRLDGWKRAVQAGHEIGNHSLNHPCSGNFLWARDKALEDYTLEEMRVELEQATDRVEELVNVRPKSFAYPCGQTFVGRGKLTRSYVPLAVELFESSRGWLDEASNDPTYCDLAQLYGMEMDGKDFEQLKPVIEQAVRDGHWLVLAGHEIGEGGSQTTRITMLQKLMEYAQDPGNGIWLAPVGTISRYVLENRMPPGTSSK